MWIRTTRKYEKRQHKPEFIEKKIENIYIFSDYDVQTSINKRTAGFQLQTKYDFIVYAYMINATHIHINSDANL